MKDRSLLALNGLMLGVAVGMLVTIPAGLLAVASGGAGHGTYPLAQLLYPGPMLLWRSTGRSFDGPLIALALAQFPFYGGVIGVALPWRRASGAIACVLLALHLGAAALASPLLVRLDSL